MNDADDFMADLNHPPLEFNKLARAFFADSLQLAKDEDEWIANALRLLDSRSKAVVKGFLVNLLAKHPAEADLQKLWNAAGSDYFIVGNNGHDGMRWFLTRIKDHIK